MENKIEDFTVLSVIGTGSFGTCYKVLRKNTGEIFVWKAVDYGKMPEEKKQLLVSEVNLLSGIEHPNIVRYYDRIIHKPTTTIYIIMEWCAGGDLSFLVNECKRNKTQLNETFVWRILYQLARALQACHSFVPRGPVLHRDIKPANVFLDGNGNIKLGDFGLAYLMQDGTCDAKAKVVGTPFYMSPEAIQDGFYSVKSDIWALGCLIYELCALEPPFSGSNFRRLLRCIRESRFSRIPSEYSEDLQNIITFMLRVEHNSRPSVDAILHHPSVVMHIVESTLEIQHTSCNCATYTSHESPDTSTEERAKLKDALVIKSDQLRLWEDALRLRELELYEREQVVTKREKRVVVAECMVKDKVMRAELYLQHHSKYRAETVSSRSCKSDAAPCPLSNSSVCTDQGDTSILPSTSAKLSPSKIEKPSVFNRVGSTRHVHFGTLPKLKDPRPISMLSESRSNSQGSTHQTSSFKDCSATAKHSLGQSSKVKTSKSKGVTTLGSEHTNLPSSSLNVHHPANATFKSTSSSEQSSRQSSGSSVVTVRQAASSEQMLWLQQKRALFFGANKENVPVDHRVIDNIDIIKRSEFIRKNMATFNLKDTSMSFNKK